MSERTSNHQLIAIEMGPISADKTELLVRFNRSFTTAEMNAMHRALNLHLVGAPVETSAPRALAFGDEVTYAPLYDSKLPREGWKVEVLPKLTYVIKHPNGSLIAVDAGEINAVEPSERQLPVVRYDPVGYQYLYTDPFSGSDIWRNHSDLWNGQNPHGSREVYTRTQLKASEHPLVGKTLTAATPTWDCACNDPTCAYCGSRLLQKASTERAP